MTAKKEPPDSEYTTRDVYRRKRREYEQREEVKARKAEYRRRLRERQRAENPPSLVTCPFCLQEFHPQGYYEHEAMHRRDDPPDRGDRGAVNHNTQPISQGQDG